MKAIDSPKRYVLALALFCAISATTLSAHASEDARGDLLALERRAMQAKTLLEEVGKLKEQLAESRKRQLETEARVAALEQSEQTKTEQITALKADIAKANQQLALRDKLIMLFRSGTFEYFEVQNGDTLESIAANPMTYGDNTKAALIGLVNDVKTNSLPIPGSVLIIPRFTEGVNYEF